MKQNVPVKVQKFKLPERIIASLLVYRASDANIANKNMSDKANCANDE